MAKYTKAELDNMIYEFRDVDLKTGKIVNTFYVKGEICIPNSKLVHEMNRWFDVPDYLKTAGCDCVAQRIM